MDYILRALIFFLCFFAFPLQAALPGLPKFNVTRVGSVSTYKLDSAGSYSPATFAPTGAGVQGLNSNMVARGSNYVTGMEFKELLAKPTIKYSISAAELAAGVVSLVPRLNALGAVITVGSAIYMWMQASGLHDNNGQILTNGDLLPPAQPGAWTLCGNAMAGYLAQGYGATYDYECVEYASLYKVTLLAYSKGTKNVAGSLNYPYASTCPSGSTLTTSGYCTGNVSSPITDAQAKTQLVNAVPVDFAPIVKQLYDASPDAAPTAAASPQIDTLPAPASSPQQQTVTPDGRVQTKQDTTTLTQIAPDTFTATTTTTTTTTNIDNTTSTVTTHNASSLPVEPPVESKTDCEKYPTHIGCSEYGTAPAAELIPVTNAPATMNYTSWGSGSCPASVITVRGLVTFDYTPFCNNLVIMKPILITCALLASLFIVAGAVKD